MADRSPSGPGARRRWAWVAMALLVLGALVVANADQGGARTDEDRARHLAATVRCPTCRGQSVLESSAPTARSIRAEIARRIGAGQTDDEIRAYLVSVHGPTILLTPPRSGLAGLVWVLPVAGLLASLGGAAWAFRRWSAAPELEVSEADRALVADALAQQSPGDEP